MLNLENFFFNRSKNVINIYQFVLSLHNTNKTTECGEKRFPACRKKGNGEEYWKLFLKLLLSSTLLLCSSFTLVVVFNMYINVCKKHENKIRIKKTNQQ